MERILAIIGVIMALIFVSAVVLTSYESGKRDEKKKVALFEVAPEKVDHIRIEGPDGAEVAILREGGAWVLPDLDDFPADATQVKDMLDRLLLTPRILPAGSGAEAQQEYKVGDDNFERHVTLSQGETVLTSVYLGGAQGPQQSHARLAGQAEVYAIAFGLYEAHDDPQAWLDRNLLQIPAGDIASIEVNGLHLVQETQNGTTAWRLDGADSGETVDSEAATRLANRLAELHIEGLRDTETEPDYALDDPQLSFTVTRRDGTRVDFVMGQSALESDWSLKASVRPEHFRVSTYIAHRLKEAARREVLLAKENQHAAK